MLWKTRNSKNNNNNNNLNLTMMIHMISTLLNMVILFKFKIKASIKKLEKECGLKEYYTISRKGLSQFINGKPTGFI
jgi:hypothetical protein